MTEEVPDPGVREVLDKIPFGVVDYQEISLARALRVLKLDFASPPAAPRSWPDVVVRRIVVEQEAEALELEPSEEQLQELMRQFRVERELYSAAETEAFLAGAGLTLDDFGEAMEMLWRERALRERHAAAQVERTFLQHVTEYDRALLSELVVENENLARELLLQLRDEEDDFASLARR